MIRNACLAAARFCTAAWAGAAALFVVNGIRLVTSPVFDSAAKDRMALIRFPPYYLFGFILVGVSFLATLGLGGSQLRSARRNQTLMLLACALGLMAYDWFRIYQPLVEIISTPGLPRTPEFQSLHRQSEIVNTIQVGMVFLASLCLSWPRATLQPYERQ